MGQVIKSTKDISSRLECIRAGASEVMVPLLKDAESIARRLRRGGFRALFVGGVVRDLVLGRDFHEIDIASDALPEQVAKLFRKTLFVGAAFGVVQVITRNNAFEIATFRKERGYSDGRHPDSISPGTLEEDVERRDFTVNGLVLDPAAGLVHDFVGGLADADARVIRAIGDPSARLAEDYLRCLRAVRFAAVLGFDMEPATRRAVEESAPGLARISRERVAGELQKLCAAGSLAPGLALVFGLGLHPYVFTFLPELALPRVRKAALEAVESLPQGTDLAAALVALTSISRPDLVLDDSLRRELASLLDQEADSLRLSSGERKRLEVLSALVRCCAAAEGVRLARRVELYRSSDFPIAATIAKRVCAATGRSGAVVDRLEEERLNIPPEQLAARKYLTGRDLIRQGFPPGPDYKRLLREAEDLAVEGTIRSRQEALDWLVSMKSSLKDGEEA